MKDKMRFIVLIFCINVLCYILSRTMDVLIGGIGDSCESLVCSAVWAFVIMFFIFLAILLHKDEVSLVWLREMFSVMLVSVLSYFVYGLLITIFADVHYDARINKMFSFLGDKQGFFLFLTLVLLFLLIYTFFGGSLGSKKKQDVLFAGFLVAFLLALVSAHYLSDKFYNPFSFKRRFGF